ncbi:hypothetical protein ZHAS_00015837 [Anopheles sinensis]|uniref:Uncharacterized protein n=1 Tax=Anopheles sinensis TaxID=74873 RepID=A0A084WC23_ANOSI|nr:hypothetical protein ZHAS_00015837 [Anopheles sinensis]
MSSLFPEPVWVAGSSSSSGDHVRSPVPCTRAHVFGQDGPWKLMDSRHEPGPALGEADEAGCIHNPAEDSVGRQGTAHETSASYRISSATRYGTPEGADLWPPIQWPVLVILQ